MRLLVSNDLLQKLEMVDRLMCSSSVSRTPWEAEKDSCDLQSLLSKGHVNEEGYVNIASQLGMSGIRGMIVFHHPTAGQTCILIIGYIATDCSTYHQWGYRRGARWY